jgi:hypothetical protein
MLFYRKGLRGRKTPLPFVVYARKAVILRGQIWSAHESDVVGLGIIDQRVISLTGLLVQSHPVFLEALIFQRP